MSIIEVLHLTKTYRVFQKAPGLADALRSLFQSRYNDWTLGLRLDVPLGYRDAHSAVRAARLNLAQSYAVVQDQEQKAARFLELEYRQLFVNP